MYGKIFTSMFDGTLATVGPWQALITFQQLIILADQHGVVDMTSESIARRTTVPLDIIQAGLEALEKPDPQSRTPDEEGRRIIRLSDSRPWGWQIVNYIHYRQIRTAEDRREYHRQYAHKRRSKAKGQQSQQMSTKSTGVNPKQPIAEAEAEAKKSSAVTNKSKRPTRQSFDEWWKEVILTSPAYQGINLERELAKMKVWLTKPENIGRKLNTKFALNWLNKIDPGVPVNGFHSSAATKACWKRVEDGEHFRQCKLPVIGHVNGNPYCSLHPVPATNGVKA